MKRTQKRKGTKPNAVQRAENREEREFWATESLRMDLNFNPHGNPCHVFNAARRDREYLGRIDNPPTGKARNPKKNPLARRPRPHYHDHRRDDGARIYAF